MREGWTRTADGTLYKLNQLEKYYQKGWLRFGNRSIRAEDKLSAGLQLQRDFYKSGLFTMKAIDLEKARVDTSINAELPPEIWDARKRFFNALRAVKSDNLKAVQIVVLDDKPIVIAKESAVQYAHDHALAQHFLCCGLDDLAIHYGCKPVKAKVVGFNKANFWEE